MKYIVKLGLVVLGGVSLSAQTFGSEISESNIGENFEKGAFSLSMSSQIYKGKGVTRIYSAEGGEYYFMKGLSAGLELDSTFNFHQDSIDNDYTMTFRPNFRYTFGYDPTAQKGMAYSAILGTSFSFGDSNNPNTIVYNSAYLSPSLRADYFIASRASFYAELHTTSFTIYSDYEDEYEAMTGNEFESERAFWLRFGLSYTFAKSDFKK